MLVGKCRIKTCEPFANKLVIDDSYHSNQSPLNSTRKGFKFTITSLFAARKIFDGILRLEILSEAPQCSTLVSRGRIVTADVKMVDTESEVILHCR